VADPDDLTGGMTLQQKASRVRLLLFDVDGVLTDGIVVMHADGSESKSFHIRDGAAIVWAQRAGLQVGLLSARSSAATAQRAAQLAIRLVSQGVPDKLTGYEQLVKQADVSDESVSFMGDDLLDLPVVGRVGLSGAPADAAEEVRQRVDWVSRVPGGRGAVRDMIELVLRAQHKWVGVVDQYSR
jgi:3-deoxy-D-manno-octulosonate 8-phosphate phosphatase (KDO 8-P phosphatase)